MNSYQSWDSMKRRCDNPDHKDFPRYGGVGITYPETWKSFDKFKLDMGFRPPGTTLGRIKNSESYSKENCRWETLIEQSYNRKIPLNNSSGVKGVSWKTAIKKWITYRAFEGKRKVLYSGTSYEEACRVSLEWDMYIQKLLEQRRLRG